MPVTIQYINWINSKYQWQGYEIAMSDKSKNIICKISNTANCCETFGIYTKNELSKFIGAEYQSVTVTKEQNTQDFDYMRIVNVAIQTDRGEILIQLYNEHNGYYPHEFFTQTEYGTTIQSL